MPNLPFLCCRLVRRKVKVHCRNFWRYRWKLASLSVAILMNLYCISHFFSSCKDFLKTYWKYHKCFTDFLRIYWRHIHIADNPTSEWNMWGKRNCSTSFTHLSLNIAIVLGLVMITNILMWSLQQWQKLNISWIKKSLWNECSKIVPLNLKLSQNIKWNVDSTCKMLQQFEKYIKISVSLIYYPGEKTITHFVIRVRIEKYMLRNQTIVFSLYSTLLLMGFLPQKSDKIKVLFCC